MIRVIVADDHDVIREGIKRILEDTSDIRIAAEARDGQELIELARTKSHDVILMDITMPGRGGLEALKLLKQDDPKRPVLVLSMHEESQYAVRVLRAGAAGYLTKAHVSEHLVDAIRRVHGGSKYLTPAVADLLAQEVGSDPQRAAHERLSDREHQVFLLMAAGKTVSEIAEQLSLSAQTISTYRSHILEKLGVENTAQIIRYAHQHQLV